MPKLNFPFIRNYRDVKPLATKCSNILYLIFKVKCRAALPNHVM